MKKLIFALIMTIVASTQIAMGSVEELPGVKSANFLILYPVVPTSTAIMNLQPPMTADNEFNSSLNNFHNAYVSLITRDLNEDNIAQANVLLDTIKKEAAKLKLSDEIKSEALQRYFSNLVSIARTKVREHWAKHRVTMPKTMDLLLDADFLIDPFVAGEKEVNY